MHSTALALNWQIWGRHRWGLAGALVIVAGICAMPQAYPPAKLTSNVGDTGMPFMMAILMPFGFVILYLAYVFSHAELGKHAGSSGFPSWMFTLPVRTPWLVLWPMLSAAVTVALTWLAVGWFALNKVGLEVPLVWPALGLGCTLVWIQAVDWSPLGFVSKALVALAVLAGLWTGLFRDDTRDATFAALPVILLLGFVAGSVGVNRLRRGGRKIGSRRAGLRQIRSVGEGFPRLRFGLVRRSGAGRRFATPQQAQLWLEWRRNGSLLPLLATCWVLLVALFMIISSEQNAMNMMTATPYLALILAPVAGLILGKPDVWSRQVRLPTFAAGRPLTCGDMFLTKLRMTAMSLLAAWLVLVVALAIWLGLGSHYADLWKTLERVPLEFGTARLYAMIAASLIGFFGFDLLLMAGTFVVSFTGRFWTVLATLFLYLGGIPNLLALDALKIIENHIVELETAALVMKLLLAGSAFWYCYRRGLLAGAGIGGLVAIWMVTVGSAFLAFYLAFPGNPTDVVYRSHYLRDHALVLGLLCPLLRLALAPMALAWNRHR
jgi:hypothetical protein